MTTKKTVDTLLNLATEAVRLISGYAIIVVPLGLIPLAPISVITLLLYTTILTDIPAWVNLLPLRLLICLAIAVGLEGFAMICLVTGSRAEEWNLSKEPGEPRLNQAAGRWALAAYIVLGMAMVIVGEILPHYEVFQSTQVARWTLLGFFLLAPFGHWIFSTEAAIRRLEARRAEREAQARVGREDELRQAQAATALREREAAIQEREAQAQAIRERARAEAIEAQARERQAEAEIIRQRAALARAETRKGQAEERSGTIQEHSQTVPEINQQREQQLARVLENAGHDPFGPLDVLDSAGLTRKQFYNLMEYAKGRGTVRQVGRGQYVYTNGKGEQ